VLELDTSPFRAGVAEALKCGVLRGGAHTELSDDEHEKTDGEGEGGSMCTDSADQDQDQDRTEGVYLRRGAWKAGNACRVVWRGKTCNGEVQAVWRSRNHTVKGANVLFPRSGDTYYYTVSEIQLVK